MPHQIDSLQLRKFLKGIIHNRDNDIDLLFEEIRPEIFIDRDTEDTLLKAKSPNKIIVGSQCTIRLQAHAYVSAILFGAITPNFATLQKYEKDKILTPADDLFTWAVGKDLQLWYAKVGIEVCPEQILPNASSTLPAKLLQAISKDSVILGEGLFRNAMAFILLHELAHLKLNHSRSTISHEKDADAFAAKWLIEGTFDSKDNKQAEASRLSAIMGIAIALTWITIYNIGLPFII